MKKLKRVSITTNILLAIIVSIVTSVCIFPEPIVPIYGGNKISAIYNGDRSGSCVSIMINVYENTEVVNKMIALFDEKGVKCTFFVGGCWADDNEQTLKKIVSSGHELANHGYFHKDHKNLSYQKNQEEISNTEKIVYALSGVKTTLFAPPSGSFSTTTLDVAFDLGYKVIMWSKDTIDWRDSDTSLIFKRATNGVCGGDLILMHPKPHTLKVLPDIIDYYISLNLSVTTVSQNLSNK